MAQARWLSIAYFTAALRDSAAMILGVGFLHRDWVAPDRRVMLGLEIKRSVEVDPRNSTMFGRSFGRKKPPEEPEQDYDEEAEMEWDRTKSQFLETLLGKEHDMVMHAVPYSDLEREPVI